MRPFIVLAPLLTASAFLFVFACSSSANDTETDGGIDAGNDAEPTIDPCANVNAIRATCQALPERFDASTTLAKGCYHAAKTPVLGPNVTLTVSPGTTLIFADETGLDVGETTSLVAAGTRAEPICFTSDKAQRGAWRGLTLGRTEGGDHKLDWVTIEYAGSTKSDSKAAALKLESDSRAVRFSLTNSTIRESEGFGLYLIASGQANAFAANTFTKNTLGPASVDSEVVRQLDSASKYAGNDRDEVTVRTNRIVTAGAWKAIGVPFHLSGNLNVDAAWTLEAPNTVIIPPDSWVSINGDNAALHAVGTAAQPIVFTGETKTRGSYIGLVFDGTMNLANQLEFVTVEYGGSTAHDKDGAAVKAIADSHGVTLNFANVTVRESEGYGVYLAASAVLPALRQNTFTKNTLGPLYIGSEAAHQLEATTTYTGNDIDRVHVHASRVKRTVTWQDIGVPYELDGNMHVDEVWSLAPGVTLLMAKEAWISMGGDGAGFYAVGTAQKPITISGSEKTSGYWHSLIFDTTLNSSNHIEYATVEYGGSKSGAGEIGMIQAQADSHGVALIVKSSTIRGSGQWGIFLAKSAKYNDDITSSNTFENNVAGNVNKQP